MDLWKLHGWSYCGGWKWELSKYVEHVSARQELGTEEGDTA